MKYLTLVLIFLSSATCVSQTALDSLRADVLGEAATALRSGHQHEAAIWLSLVSEIARPDFKEYYQTTFPRSLDLFIERKSLLAEAAQNIKFRLSIKKI